MLGDIKIYFGNVVDVIDIDEKIFRCRISIEGYTEKIPVDKLPWYYPFGFNHLPLKDDVVPVIIFDDNFLTGFYGPKVDILKSNLSGIDYENYLEIFKRMIDNKQVQLTYTVQKGIEFINDKSSITLLLDKILLGFDGTNISISKDQINIGTSGLEPTLLGNKTVTELKDIITHQKNTITEICKLLTQIASVCTTPFTAPIGSMITTNIPILQPKLFTENSTIATKADNLQSKVVNNG